MAAFSLEILYKYAALVALIAFSLLAVSDCCYYDSECEVNEVCCNHKCLHGSSCVGQSCTYDSRCSSGESCCSSSCVSSSSCDGRHCSSDSDCSRSQTCCNSKCKYGGCLGFSCSTDSDCAETWLNCCDGKCTYDDCADTTAAIIGSIVGSFIFFTMIIACIVFARRRQRALLHGRVIVGQRATATTLTTTSANIQSNPPHPGQVPPPVSYQPGYPHYPPAQYEQQQLHMTNPSPYNPGTTTAREQPPPSYTEATQGVYARSSCSTDSDCGTWLECCDGKCTYDNCADTTAVIIGSVVALVAFFVVIFVSCAVSRHRQRARLRGRGCHGRGVTATTVTTTGSNIQSNPPHPGQVPPSVSYQPGYPHYPPVQYGQQQLHMTNPPPPYNPETMTASEQPPPSYTEATQGVYAPRTN
ncbi:hypothetical protein ACROYT_G018118 [Oculina patagonica]